MGLTKGTNINWFTIILKKEYIFKYFALSPQLIKSQYNRIAWRNISLLINDYINQNQILVGKDI